MKLWYKACPRCQGDLVRKADFSGVPYVHCLQCGKELTSAQEVGLRRLGFVPATHQQTAPPVHVEGWRRWA